MDYAYANAYWDGGAELDLPMGHVIGAVDTSLPLFHKFYMYGHHEDFVAGDCGPVTFGLKIDRSNTADPNGCPTGYSSQTLTKVVNSCSGGNVDFLFAGSSFGGSYRNDLHRRYYRSTIPSDGGEAQAADVGCWQVATEEDCNLIEF